MNPRGFSQVLEELVNGSSTPSMSYLLGLTPLGQTDGSGVTRYLMPDAQGSTRLVTDPSGSIVTRYAFDAYGNLLFVPVVVVSPPITKILYPSHQFHPPL